MKTEASARLTVLATAVAKTVETKKEEAAPPRMVRRPPMGNGGPRFRPARGPSDRGFRPGGGRGGFYEDDEKGEAKLEKMVKAAEKKLEALYNKLLVKALKFAEANGIPKKWATDYYKNWYDECEEGLYDAIARSGAAGFRPEAENLRSGMEGDGILSDFSGDLQGKSIQEVKKMGEQLIKSPKTKINLLKKLGFTGPEFYAFCLLVKEQIK